MKKTKAAILSLIVILSLALIWGNAAAQKGGAQSLNVLAYEKAVKNEMPIVVDISSPT
jgi:hypothetical protein